MVENTENIVEENTIKVVNGMLDVKLAKNLVNIEQNKVELDKEEVNINLSIRADFIGIVVDFLISNVIFKNRDVEKEIEKENVEVNQPVISVLSVLKVSVNVLAIVKHITVDEAILIIDGIRVVKIQKVLNENIGDLKVVVAENVIVHFKIRVEDDRNVVREDPNENN